MKAVKKSGIEWTDFGVNITKGCSYACKYCYGKFMLVKRFKKLEHWEKPALNPHLKNLRKEVSKIPKGARVLLCPTCDPYQPEHLEKTRSVIETILEKSEAKVLVLTKSHMAMQDYDLFSEYKSRVWLGFTVTSLSVNEWEPLAPPPSLRIDALKRAKSLGLNTFVSIEPWLPGITKPVEIARELRKYVDWFIIGKLSYFKTPEGYYRKQLPEVIRKLEIMEVRYLIKDNLHKYLDKKGKEKHRKIAEAICR